jgi:hypothetical protein
VVSVADLGQLEVSADIGDKDLQELSESMTVEGWPVSSPGQVMEGFIRKLPYPYGAATDVKATDKEDKTTRVTLNGSFEDIGCPSATWCARS